MQGEKLQPLKTESKQTSYEYFEKAKNELEEKKLLDDNERILWEHYLSMAKRDPNNLEEYEHDFQVLREKAYLKELEDFHVKSRGQIIRTSMRIDTVNKMDSEKRMEIVTQGNFFDDLRAAKDYFETLQKKLLKHTNTCQELIMNFSPDIINKASLARNELILQEQSERLKIELMRINTLLEAYKEFTDVKESKIKPIVSERRQIRNYIHNKVISYSSVDEIKNGIKQLKEKIKELKTDYNSVKKDYNNERQNFEHYLENVLLKTKKTESYNTHKREYVGNDGLDNFKNNFHSLHSQSEAMLNNLEIDDKESPKANYFSQKYLDNKVVLRENAESVSSLQAEIDILTSIKNNLEQELQKNEQRKKQEEIEAAGELVDNTLIEMQKSIILDLAQEIAELMFNEKNFSKKDEKRMQEFRDKYIGRISEEIEGIDDLSKLHAFHRQMEEHYIKMYKQENTDNSIFVRDISEGESKVIIEAFELASIKKEMEEKGYSKKQIEIYLKNKKKEFEKKIAAEHTEVFQKLFEAHYKEGIDPKNEAALQILENEIKKDKNFIKLGTEEKKGLRMRLLSYLQAKQMIKQIQEAKQK